ncbi:MAG TPA: DNA-processing protein DprA [Candidatus Limnocylindrales bacterium]|nr:DNA-processing protein DprA [Candidatus Limnocylindrales bacterium]
MDARLIWLGLSMAPRIGPRRLKQMLPAFGGDVAALWEASALALQGVGLDARSSTEFTAFRGKVRLDEHWRKIEAAGAQLIFWPDDDYPPLLAHIDDPPIALYVRGSLNTQDRLALAIVGARKASAYGRDVAHHFASKLAARGVTIISGLAHGVDAAAHRGALEAGGRTLAVLGSGLDVIYPYDHRGLADEIAAQGALISEFPLGTKRDPFNFPRRNRIISGLSLGVLVAEATDKSGALITASLAAEQGKDVFAVPGNIFTDASSGVNRLIQDGAKPVMRVEDILEELSITAQAAETRQTAERVAPADPVEAQVLAAVGPEGAHVDALARATGLPMQTLLSTLMLMELKGLIAQIGPMHYTRMRG